ncbi:MAG: hypothetical protein MI864_15865 [Pseudomonadales bacterium]|nr:hypothetical protein [Pseudomonadales bacterium]
MITSNFNSRATLFYFNDVNQLHDFESFKVCPVHTGQQIPDSETVSADYWCVFGIYKADKVKANHCLSFPVADLPTELYANLFAHMCRQLVSDMSEGGFNTLEDALTSQVMSA